MAAAATSPTNKKAKTAKPRRKRLFKAHLLFLRESSYAGWIFLSYKADGYSGMQSSLLVLLIGNVLASLAEIQHSHKIIVPWKELTLQLNFCLNTH
jgi:hypothetical protein